jgi:hypothetical protein
VQQQRAVRTWIWGPNVRWRETEPYAESPNGLRQVVYFDKSRMEITNPNGDEHSIWFVTNGLLVTELISGRMQTGDSRFEQRLPADVNVAGDPDDRRGPMYSTFTNLLSAAPAPDGALLTQRVGRDGTVSNDAALARYNVTAAHRVQVPGLHHQVASVFWSFMNSSGLVYLNGNFVTAPLFQDPFYATGYPITEAYWANVRVGGQQREVLMQCFQRRCLTYTPDNPLEWRVEMGNVGDHYYRWRYCGEEGGVVFAPEMSLLPEFTSPSGTVHHYYDPATSSFVMEDRTPVNQQGQFSSWLLPSPPNEARPVDYSITVDIVTLNHDVTRQSLAYVGYRSYTSESGLYLGPMTTIAMDGNTGTFLFREDGSTLLLTPYREIPSFNAGYGAVNRLKIVVRGDLVRIEVNGVLVQELRLPEGLDMTANGFYFGVERNYPGDQPVTRFGFRNLIIRELQTSRC